MLALMLGLSLSLAQGAVARGYGPPATAPNALTLGGAPMTFGGQALTYGDA